VLRGQFTDPIIAVTEASGPFEPAEDRQIICGDGMSLMLAAGKLIGDAKLIAGQGYNASRDWIHCVAQLFPDRCSAAATLLNRDWNCASIYGEREFTDRQPQQMALPGLRCLLLDAKIVLLGAKAKRAKSEAPIRSAAAQRT
jgi:hypothetical protein